MQSWHDRGAPRHTIEVTHWGAASTASGRERAPGNHAGRAGRGRAARLQGLLAKAGAQAEEDTLPGRVHAAAAGRIKVERRVALAHAQVRLHLAQARGVAAQRGLRGRRARSRTLCIVPPRAASRAWLRRAAVQRRLRGISSDPL